MQARKKRSESASTRALHSVPTQRSLTTLFWNYLSVAILGGTGLILNYLVALLYDPSVLGVMNQSLAVFVFGGQLASAGIGHSVLAHLPRAPDSAGLIRSALKPAFYSALSVSLLVYFAADAFGSVLKSTEVAIAVHCLVPGIFFFGMNKVFLSVVNAQNHMTRFGVYSTLRYCLLLGGLLVAIYTRVPGAYLSSIFSVSEGILFFILVAEVFPRAFKRGTAPPLEKGSSWEKRHFSFGVKSVLSGLALEANSRADILMLGVFLEDHAVGIYSVAALTAEGFLQLIVVIQNLNHPTVSRLFGLKQIKELETYARRMQQKTFWAILGVGMLTAFLYPYGLQLVFPSGAYAESYTSLLLLLGGIVIASGALGFQHTLLVTGFPTTHSFYILGLLLVNLLVGFLLIPRFGIEGAAVAAGISFAITLPAQKLLFRWVAGIRF